MSIGELTRIDRAIEIAAPVERVWRAQVYRDNNEGWAEVLVWLQTYAEKTR